MSDNNILDLPDPPIESVPSAYGTNVSIPSVQISSDPLGSPSAPNVARLQQKKLKRQQASALNSSVQRKRAVLSNASRQTLKVSNSKANLQSSPPLLPSSIIEDPPAHSIIEDGDIFFNTNELEDDSDMDLDNEETSQENKNQLQQITSVVQTLTNPIMNQLVLINDQLTSQNTKFNKRLSTLETLYRQSLEKIQNLEQKLDAISSVNTRTSNLTQHQQPHSEKILDTDIKNLLSSTWAQRAANGPAPNTNIKPTKPTFFPKSKRILVIPQQSTSARLTSAELLTIRNTINNTLKESKAPSNAFVTIVHQNEKGNLVLQTRGDCLAETVLEFKEQLMKALDKTSDDIKVHETWAKLIVHNIPLDLFPDTQTGMALLQEEIQSCNSTVQLMLPPRYMSRPENRLQKSASSVVIAVRSISEANKILKNHLLIHNHQRRTERYYQAKPTDQCTNCQGFGHVWQRCMQSPNCRHCGLGHKSSEHSCTQCPNNKGKPCLHIQPTCRNCNGNHRPTDSNCPHRLSLLPTTNSKSNTTSTFPTVDINE